MLVDNVTIMAKESPKYMLYYIFYDLINGSLYYYTYIIIDYIFRIKMYDLSKFELNSFLFGFLITSF